ncbi:sensor histidine kinase [Thermostichus vulcanus]|uniref:histidine kinase n=1 Tax=Thermostichus vulcanus str. 'Rupite' TaxID=2813851 RepID=A0ABT0C6I0_THEVL|nr:histidine kinase dimerization/phospho-acceptor domain-containing protein [Thermostichus vulcanus]MCJ2541403.1 sensor histidine kinase [Thermostichus vulcanus str. 'Rupite']
MNSYRLPSLLQSLWADLPLPEWLPAAGERSWQQTVAALIQLWQEVGQFGVVLSGPVSWLPPWVIRDPLPQLPVRIDTLETTLETALKPRDPAREAPWLFTPDLSPESILTPGQTVIPLLPRDPLVEEPFLLVLTPVFSAVAAQGHHPHTRQTGMMISFEPEVVHRAWQSLEQRVQQGRPDRLPLWQSLAKHYPLMNPHVRVLARFSSLLLLGNLAESGSQPARLPPATPTTTGRTTEVVASPDSELGEPEASSPSEALPKNSVSRSAAASKSPAQPNPPPHPDNGLSEAELLRALIHEVQTPLSTIRTLASLILKRSDLPPRVRDYAEKIDRECTEQINRFGLFFQATETVMPTTEAREGHRLQLEPIALVDLVRQNLPRWQEQVERRGSQFDLEIPDELPDVVSDPKALEAVLFGMIDRIARSTPAGSRIRAQLVSAGDLVKLQFQVDTPESGIPTAATEAKSPQAIGQLLVLQPDTGAVSLSIPVTQTLFRALGGYLTVRHRAHQGEVLNIYLPRQL